MKTATINLLGKPRTLCFSLRVMRDCTERYGGVEKIADALVGESATKVLDESIWLLSRLMDAGARYCNANGIDHNEPLTIDDMYDSCDVVDLQGIKGIIFDTITDGIKGDIEIEGDSKNAKTTQGR